MLMLHGWGVDHRIMLRPMENVFHGEKHACFMRIYIDLPGMGKSTVSEQLKNSMDMLDVLNQFIDELIPNQSFLLAGESYGGYLSRALVQQKRHDILGVLLICPLMKPGYRQGTVEPMVVLERDEELIQNLSVEDRDYFEYMTIVQNEDVWESYQKDILDALKTRNLEFLNHILDGDLGYELDETFEKPALILAGKEDTEVGYQDQFELLRRYPRASFAVLDKAGHNLQIEQEDLFEHMVFEWLERTTESMGVRCRKREVV